MTTGTNADDTLTTSAAGDVLIGRSGDDFLQSVLDDTTLFGNAGDDTLETVLPAFPDRFFDLTRHSEQYGGSGNDSLSMISGFHWLSYDNFISIQSGGSGDDTIHGLATRLWAYGGSGNDVITQKTYADEGSPFMHVDGGSGADTINATLNGSDVVYGDAHILGGGGADVINLDGRIEGSATTIEGGAGADTIDVSLSSKDGGNVDVMMDAGGGADIVQVYANGTSIGGSDVHLMGGAGADHITARALASLVRCTLAGGAGDDTLIYNPANGRDGGRVDGVLFGDSGNDHLEVTIRPGSIILDYRENQRYDLMLDGGSGHDLINVTIGRYFKMFSDPDATFSTDIKAYGGLGNDTIEITGGIGNLIDGGTGNDRLKGSENADHIKGGAGADTLEGQAGDDTLSGGGGSDTFVFSATDFGTTTITDWSGSQDRLDLDFIDLNGNGLLDEVLDNVSYIVGDADGYLYLSANAVIVFEGARARRDYSLDDLFLNPDMQLI